MKHSFFLVIPKQKTSPQRLREFDEKILKQWIAELPIANPLLASRLVYDYISELNGIKMPTQLRLDALESLRPSFLAIEEYLLSRLVKTDFPKEENDKKILRFLVSLQREFTLSYWIAVKELTGNSVGWFQGKNTSLGIQRCIKGLSNIIKSHFIMGMPIPDWIWIDLHSFYKLSVKLKKHNNPVPLNDNSEAPNRTCSPEEAYIEIILLSLADPRGLMQREINLVLSYAEHIHSLISFKNQPVFEQHAQCVILAEEDKPPVFQANNLAPSESSKLFVDFTALYKAFDESKLTANPAESRFARLNQVDNKNQGLSPELLEYLKLRWAGIPLRSASLFEDRLDRYVSIGLTSIFKMQKPDNNSEEEDLEYLAYSVSDRALSCIFRKPSILSVGSLISFRKKDAPANRRALGVIDKLIVEKETGKLSFGVNLLTQQAIAINYFLLNSNESFKKALFYQTKDTEIKSYLIADTFQLKPGDPIRLFIEHDEYNIILHNKKNIGLGYWQFECLKAHDKKKMDSD